MQVMTCYKLKPGQVEGNLEALHAVYHELASASPDGLRWVSFQLPDELTFVGFVDFAGEPGTAPHHRLASFQRYRAALSERCDEQPVAYPLRRVGSYRFPEPVAPGIR
jgi:hypothetical protein